MTETGQKQVTEQFFIRLEEVYEGWSCREWGYWEALNIDRHLLSVAKYESFKKRV